MQKNHRKKYRGGDEEPSQSGIMKRMSDFWNWITGKKDVPSPTNGEIPEAPVETFPFEEDVKDTDKENMSEEPPTDEQTENSPFGENTEDKPLDENVEDKPLDENIEDKPLGENTEGIPFGQDVEKTNKEPPSNEPNKTFSFENPGADETKDDSLLEKKGGKSKKRKQNRSTKKRRKQ